MLQVTRQTNEGVRLYRNGLNIGRVIVDDADSGTFTISIGGFVISAEPIGDNTGAYVGLTDDHGDVYRVETWPVSGAGQIGLGVAAPKDVKIWRDEIDPNKEK